MNYVEIVENFLEEELKMKGTKYEGLLSFYSLLVMTVGKNCTQENIHDAWSLWQNKQSKEHKSLLPFDELTKEVQELDEKYRISVVNVSKIISGGNKMKFGKAQEEMENGKRVARINWNGKGMYIFMFFGSEIFNIKEPHAELSMRDFICMKTAKNDLVPWVASQTDLSADDWVVV